MSDPDRRWTHDHPDGPRLDVNGVAWFACDPYPTWYRWGNSGLVIASPRFPKPAPTEKEAAMSDKILDQVAEIISMHVDHCIGVEPDQPDNAARALAEAGLLAGLPLVTTTEWGVSDPALDKDLDPWWVGPDPADEAEARAVAERHRDLVVRRQVTAWGARP